jgi:hypothetical protein
MVLEGHIQDGKIIVEAPVPLANGTAVTVTVSEKKELKAKTSLGASLLELAGTVSGLPPDAAKNHDYYLRHGLPK